MEVRLITEKKFLSHTRSIEAFSDVRFVRSQKRGCRFPRFFKQKQQAIVWSYSLDNRGPEMFCC